MLVDEEASTDRPLQTKYVHSPVQSKAGMVCVCYGKVEELWLVTICVYVSATHQT